MSKVIGWICSCTFMNGQANTHCWKCKKVKRECVPVVDVHDSEIVNGKYIKQSLN